jgi:hypothetical protein
MEHQPDLSWITHPHGHHREIGKPPGTGARNYALSLTAQIIPSHPWACPSQLAGQPDRGRQERLAAPLHARWRIHRKPDRSPTSSKRKSN